MRVTDEERAAIHARAEATGVSAPRLLVELATLGPAGATERNAVRTALFNVRRQVVGIAANINQLAKWANTRQQLPPGLSSSLAQVQDIVTAIEELRVVLEKPIGPEGAA